MRMVTVAAVQMHCSRDVTDNLERAEQLVRQAAAQGANVILLPVCNAAVRKSGGTAVSESCSGIASGSAD